MGTQIDEQLIGAKKRKEQQRSAKNKSIQTQDALKQQTYKMHYAELAIRHFDSQIKALGSLSLTNLISTLAGSKTRKLQQAEENLKLAKQEFNEYARAVTKLQTEFEELAQLAEQATDVVNEYDQLLMEKQKAILTREDEPAAKLKGVAERLDHTGKQLRILDRCLESGKETLNRLESLGRATNRARNKKINSRGTMGFGTVYNVAQQKAANPLVTRAREGIQQLSQRIAELDLSADTPNNREVAEKAPILEPLVVELHDGWIHSVVDDYSATHTIENEIRTVLNALDDKRDELENQSATLDKQRRQLIESA